MPTLWEELTFAVRSRSVLDYSKLKRQPEPLIAAWREAGVIHERTGNSMCVCRVARVALLCVGIFLHSVAVLEQRGGVFVTPNLKANFAWF